MARGVGHAASVRGAAAEVHQHHGGRALRHDHRGPAPPHREHLLGVHRHTRPRGLGHGRHMLGLRPRPAAVLAQPLPAVRPPVSAVALVALAPGPVLVSGGSLLLLGQSLAPAPLSRPEKYLTMKKYFACPT